MRRAAEVLGKALPRCVRVSSTVQHPGVSGLRVCWDAAVLSAQGDGGGESATAAAVQHLKRDGVHRTTLGAWQTAAANGHHTLTLGDDIEVSRRYYSSTGSPPAAAAAAAAMPGNNDDDDDDDQVIVVPMPKLSHTHTAGTLARWLKGEGDEVKEYDILFEVATNTLVEDAYKVGDFAGTVTLLIESQEEGYLAKRLVREGESVAVGVPVALLCERPESVPRAASEGARAVAGLNVYDDGGLGPRRSVRTLEWQSYLKEGSAKRQGDCGCM